LHDVVELWSTFARIGLFTFGGGYAMLPLLQREVVDNKEWVTEEELLDYYAIGQSTPGIIAVNTATFVGHKHKGVVGAISATLGLITPSIIIIVLLASLLDQFMDLPIIQHAFAGIRVAVCALVSVSIYRLAQKGVVDGFTLVWMIATFLGTAFFNISPIIVVVLSFGIGNLLGIVGDGAE
jgi:chromate transporter